MAIFKKITASIGGLINTSEEPDVAEKLDELFPEEEKKQDEKVSEGSSDSND